LIPIFIHSLIDRPGVETRTSWSLTFINPGYVQQSKRFAEIDKKVSARKIDVTFSSITHTPWKVAM